MVINYSGKISNYIYKLTNISTTFFQKCDRRRKALEAKATWDETKKKEIREVLIAQYMSSESEGENGFAVKHKPNESDKFCDLKKTLDDKATKMMSNRSRRQMAARTSTIASSQNRLLPLEPSHEWIAIM